METVMFFIAGLIVAAIVSYFIGKQKCKSVEQTTELKVKAESDVQIARLKSDLANCEQKVADLNRQIEDGRTDKEQSLISQKEELTENFKNQLAEQEKRFAEATCK